MDGFVQACHTEDMVAAKYGTGLDHVLAFCKAHHTGDSIQDVVGKICCLGQWILLKIVWEVRFRTITVFCDVIIDDMMRWFFPI